MTLMVIFGAGASFDSSPFNLPPNDSVLNRPPLADNLFADRVEFRGVLDRYTELHELVPQLLPKTGRSLEEVLQRLKNEGAGRLRRQQELAAVRYYLHDIFASVSAGWWTNTRQISNYTALLGQIRFHRKDGDDPTLLVTFNYDSLLERALEAHDGSKFDVVADYVKGSEYQVYKLHGSHDWGRFISGNPPGVATSGNRDPWNFPHHMIREVANLSFTDQIGVMTQANSNAFRGPPLFPAIAIPVIAKSEDSFECPRDHVEKLRAAIPRVTKILMIGWRAREEHFTSMLKNIPEPVSVFCVAGTFDEVNAALKQLKDAGVRMASEAGYEGFTHTMGDNRLADFLGA